MPLSDSYVNGNGRIHVTNLPLDANEDDMLSIFDKFGSIKRIDIKYGFAYIFYETSEQALDAINEKNGYDFKGSIIKVEAAFTSRDIPPSKAPPVVRQELRLRVLDIDNRCLWHDLKDWGRVVGPVHYTATHTLRGVPVGIIEYETEEDVEKALEILPNELLNGRNVKVIKDDPNDGPFDTPAQHHNNHNAGRGRRYDDRSNRFDRSRDFDRNAQYSRGNRDYDRGRIPRDGRDYDRPRDVDRNGGRNNYNDRDASRNGGRDNYNDRDVDRNGGRNNYNDRDATFDRRDNYPPRGDYGRGGGDYGRGGGGRDDYGRGGGGGRDDYGRGGGRGRDEDFGARRPSRPHPDDNYNRPAYDRPRSRSRERHGGDDRGRNGPYGR